MAASRHWAGVAVAVGLLLPVLAGAAVAQEAQEVTETPQPPATGSVTIIKKAMPQRYQDFRFTISGDFGSTAVRSFLLDDDNVSARPNFKVFSGLAPGTYSVTEVGVDGWTLVDLDCGDDAAAHREGSTVTVTITHQAEHVTCMFVNEKAQAKNVEVPPPAPKTSSEASSETAQPVVDAGPGQQPVLPDSITTSQGEAAPVGEANATVTREIRVLPATGPSTGWMTTGLLLIAAGALLLAVDRRRSRRRTATP
jgi:hypothetical protein